MSRHHVLIGSGPGAIAAAEAIRGLDPSAEITLVAAEPFGYYSRPGLAYYLANEVTEKGLYPFTAEDIAALKIDWVRDRATGISPEGHRVTLASGRVVPYDRLLLATGSTAIPVRVPGASLKGVVKLDDLVDARDIIRRGKGAETAVVVGGGITALEIVEGLRNHMVHVHYLMRRGRYWGNVLSEAESRIVEQGLRTRGVEIHYFSELAGIAGSNGSVVGVELVDGTRIACDMVAVAIGVHANIELASSAGLACGRGILVDEFLRSSDSDIFAAGDVAEVCDDNSDRRTIEVLWSSAVEKGRVAGANMAGEAVNRYAKGAPLNVTRLAGFKITIIGTVGGGDDADLEGLARGDSETWRRLGESQTVEWQEGETRVRLALADDAIAGAIVMGDQATSFPLQELVSARADVRPIAQRLLQPNAQVPELVDELWRDWKARGHA